MSSRNRRASQKGARQSVSERRIVRALGQQDVACYTGKVLGRGVRKKGWWLHEVLTRLRPKPVRKRESGIDAARGLIQMVPQQGFEQKKEGCKMEGGKTLIELTRPAFGAIDQEKYSQS